MSADAPRPAVDAAELEALRLRCAELEADNNNLSAVNETLMNRVERDMDMQGNSFSLFQTAISLESTVQRRTAALQQAMHDLEKRNTELKLSNAAAEAASHAKSAFLATMSHELRTPMNGVIGMTELMLNGHLGPTQRRPVEVIRRSALSLLRILNDILDFSKIEAGQLQTESLPFDPRRAADNALSLLLPQIASKGLTLRMDWPAGLPALVIGDPTRFAQILTNLVGNAFKFTATGTITVRARLVAHDADASLWGFEVEDTGIGIRAEVLPQLFQSFTQSDSSITRKFGGTGLGLAIVKRLCQLMGGDCGVRSRPGLGSTFWFTLKLEPAPMLQAPQATGVFRLPRQRQLGRGDGSQLHVLLVEDNPINQEVAVGMLELLGAQISVADNGLRALEVLTVAHAFDLVLMDCQMPEMDGLEATRRTRAHEAVAGTHVPIVALTANAMVGDREQCIAAGMDDFLSKPFQLDDLAEAISRWCPQLVRPAAPSHSEMPA